MKKCPVCKAEIPEDARFCIHCMTSFQEKETIQPPRKKHRWWLTVLLGLLLIGIGVGIALFLHRPTPPESTQPLSHTQSSPSQQTPEQILQDEPAATPASTGEAAAGNQAAVPVIPDSGGAASTPGTSQSPAGSTPSVTVPPVSTGPSTPQTTLPQSSTPPASETTASTTPPTSEATQPPSGSVYAYRAAQAGDDFSASYTNSGNDIVITGVQTPSASGVYQIPAYIDGQRVVAITANAFYDSGARTVYLPSTVRTVWNYAFNGCPLAHIYFTHNVYIQNMAFYGNTASLTIHCPSGCQDRNLRTYQSSAANYDAVWEEWNG